MKNIFELGIIKEEGILFRVVLFNKEFGVKFRLGSFLNKGKFIIRLHKISNYQQMKELPRLPSGMVMKNGDKEGFREGYKSCWDDQWNVNGDKINKFFKENFKTKQFDLKYWRVG